MATFKQRLGGKIAQSQGSQFEALLESAALAEGFVSIRIPDGCRQLGPHKIQRVKTPFDFVFVKSPEQTIYADAKTTSSKTFNYAAITEHQIYILNKLEKKGVKSGYIIYFREIDKIIFFSSEQLKSLAPRESLKPENGILLGSRFGLRLGNIFLRLHSL